MNEDRWSLVGPLRWGVLGTGTIAAKFLTDLALLPAADQVTVAVGSRTPEAARRFAEQFAIPHQHDYAGLVDDPDVDVIYVATPHPFHLEHALAAIRAGKHVLVEKPLTMTAEQAERLHQAAVEADVFLMEAMWTRFLPNTTEVRRLVHGGALGTIVSITCDLGQAAPTDPEFRLRSPDLGGGALLDMGVYGVSFASMLLGVPDQIRALATFTETGVDAQTSVIMEFPGGAHALVNTTQSAVPTNRAAIVGTRGRLEIDSMFIKQVPFTVISPDGARTPYEFDFTSRGYRFEAIEVARCVRAGLRESPVMPVAESIAVLRILDEIREQIGLTYPQHVESPDA